MSSAIGPERLSHVGEYNTAHQPARLRAQRCALEDFCSPPELVQTYEASGPYGCRWYSKPAAHGEQ